MKDVLVFFLSMQVETGLALSCFKKGCIMNNLLQFNLELVNMTCFQENCLIH